MTPEQFYALPTALALKILVEASPKLQEAVEKAEAPRRPLSPKYDFRLYRKGGFNWASEADIESLRWHQNRAATKAAEGGQWADKEAKTAEALARWVGWREWEPNACWRGTRGDRSVTAKAPSSHPDLHSKMPATNGDVREGDGYNPDAEDPF